MTTRTEASDARLESEVTSNVLRLDASHEKPLRFLCLFSHYSSGCALFCTEGRDFERSTIFWNRLTKTSEGIVKHDGYVVRIQPEPSSKRRESYSLAVVFINKIIEFVSFL